MNAPRPAGISLVPDRGVVAASERRSILRAITAIGLAATRKQAVEDIRSSFWPHDHETAEVVRAAVSPSSTASYPQFSSSSVLQAIAPMSAAVRLLARVDLRGSRTAGFQCVVVGGNLRSERYSATYRAAAERCVCQRSEAAAMNADSIQYALETDWPVGAGGFEPLHLEIRSAELHPASTGSRRPSGAPFTSSLGCLRLRSWASGSIAVHELTVQQPAWK
jgi:hypothetical protein